MIVSPTLLYPFLGSFHVQAISVWCLGVFDSVEIERVLNSHFPAIVLAHQTSNKRAGLLSQCVPRDVVGDAQENEGVEDGLELRRLVREEGIAGRGARLGRHIDDSVTLTRL